MRVIFGQTVNKTDENKISTDSLKFRSNKIVIKKYILWNLQQRTNFGNLTPTIGSSNYIITADFFKVCFFLKIRSA